MADISEGYIHEWRKKLLCLSTVGGDCLRLVLRYCLHPDPAIGTDKELANVFKNAVTNQYDVVCKNSINSLSYPSNDKKIYELDATRNKVVKDSINIDELDITFMGDILKNINSLKSATGVLPQCINGHLHYCCNNHSHKCPTCRKVTCNNTPKQCCNNGDCDHICLTCGELYSFCRRQNTFCCDSCKLCLNCSALIKCDNFIMLQNVEVIKKELRNCAMHLTNKECENPDYDFPEVDGCTTWNKTLTKFIDTLHDITNYLYGKKYIEKELKDNMFEKINRIQTGEAFYNYFEAAVSKMCKNERLKI